MGSLISIFWTSDDVCPEYHNQSGSSCLRTLSPSHDGLPKIHLCMKPVELFAASIATETLTHTIEIHCADPFLI